MLQTIRKALILKDFKCNKKCNKIDFKFCDF